MKSCRSQPLGIALFAAALALSPWGLSTRAAEDLPLNPEVNQPARFLRLHWFEPGLEHGNPIVNKRFRVNAPEVVLHKEYGSRLETKGNGLLQILMEEDPRLLTGAELALELWGGHPGTANKRVTINGRSTYVFPDVSAEMDCTHLYPVIPLKRTDLVNGYNALQFACDQGRTFWGHFIVENACLRAILPPDHPDLIKAGLQVFNASVQTALVEGNDEHAVLRLEVGPDQTARVSSVDFQGFYRGYDENGDGQATDWHGFTKARQPLAYLGQSQLPPFEITWDRSMLEAPQQVAVRAIVHFNDHPELICVTKAALGPELKARSKAQVKRFSARDLPHPFWSRDNRKMVCHIPLDVDPTSIEKAELHVVTWDGGVGTVADYFQLNGHALAVAGRGKHDVIYSKVAIDPSWLKRGDNQIELLSDTKHHGIEVLLPGPALVVRSKASTAP